MAISIISLVLVYGSKLPFSNKALWFLFASLVAALGFFFHWRSRQYLAQTVVESVLDNDKPNVLYLRSFDSDPLLLNKVFITALNPILAFRNSLSTLEEQLALAVAPLGELVAIGKPREELPTPGASRFYTTDDEWQQAVLNQMKVASLTIIRAGTSEGLLWEFKKASTELSANKTLILLYKIKIDDYDNFISLIKDVFIKSLPTSKELSEHVKGFFKGRHLSGFICFSEDWEPTFLPLESPFRFDYGSAKNYIHFRHTLKPIFETHQVNWEAPKKQGSIVANIIAAIVFIPLILIALLFLIIIIFN